MKIRILIKYASCILILFTTFQNARSQETNSFISYVGGFSLNIQGRPNGSGGNGTAGGVQFVFRSPEATYEIGFYEKLGLPYALNGEIFSFDACVKEYFNKFSQRGEKISEKELASKPYKVKEYKYKTIDNYYILRLFEVEDRIYKLLAQFPLHDEKREIKVFQIFDSFQLLDEKVVKIEFNKRIAQATPKELPQTPIVPKLKSDLEDRDLKGKIRHVLVSNAYYNLKNTIRNPLPVLYEEFDTLGNIIKSTEYDSNGNAKTVMMFGYLDGKRVARKGNVQYEYDFLGGIPLEFPKSAKADSRYDESFSYKYLNGRLVAENTYFNNGFRQSGIVTSYSKNKKENHKFLGNNRVASVKSEYLLDDKANVIELIHREKNGNKFEIFETYQFKYESFDVQGNWTKRIVLKDYGFDKNTYFVPEYIEQRVIAYY